MGNINFGRRQSDEDILHCAKNLICCEKAFNNQVDKLLEAIGVSRAEVESGSAYERLNKKGGHDGSTSKTVDNASG